MGKRAWLGLCLLCLSCASSRAVVPARTAPAFSPALADPAAKAQLTALVPQLDAYLQERFAASGATGVAVVRSRAGKRVRIFESWLLRCSEGWWPAWRV